MMTWHFVATLLVLMACATSCGPPGARDAGDVVGDVNGSASARIGPEGGVLRFEGVTLVVPAGALVAVQTLSIARAPQQTPPAGLAAYAPIYRFEPAGTQFAVPARVSMQFTGDRSRAEIYWTAAAGGAFEPLASNSVAGDEASAQVTHFSDGFVGAPELPPVDGGGMDAGGGMHAPTATLART